MADAAKSPWPALPEHHAALLTRLKATAKKPGTVTLLKGMPGSGKTTLVKQLGEDIRQASCRSIRIRSLAQYDPITLLSLYDAPVALDDCQLAPGLLEYLASGNGPEHSVILSGTPNRHLINRLAERLGERFCEMELALCPNPALSSVLIQKSGIQTGAASLSDFLTHLMSGRLPSMAGARNASNFWSDWLTAFIDEIAGKILKTSHPRLFFQFMKELASIAGEELNFSQIAKSCGISSVTARTWFDALEDACVVKQIQPIQTSSRRPVKRSKLLFMDTGLAIYLSTLLSKEQLLASPSFKGLVFNEFASSLLDQNMTSSSSIEIQTKRQ